MKLKFTRHNFAILAILLMLAVCSCATHSKHRKMRAVPCPCETQNRR